MCWEGSSAAISGGPQAGPSLPPGSFGFEKKVAGATWPLSPAKGPLGCTGPLGAQFLLQEPFVPEAEEVRDATAVQRPWKLGWCFPGS